MGTAAKCLWHDKEGRCTVFQGLVVPAFFICLLVSNPHLLVIYIYIYIHTIYIYTHIIYVYIYIHTHNILYIYTPTINPRVVGVLLHQLSDLAPCGTTIEKVQSATFSHDGSMLLTVSLDGEGKLWPRSQWLQSQWQSDLGDSSMRMYFFAT